MIRLFLSRLFGERSVWLLPVVGFALTSSIGLMVFGGAMYFYTLEDPILGEIYWIYATAALILLIIPMLALMRSAASLLARRRDERLSSLRLMGASTSQLRRLVLTESTTLAVTGILLGVGIYAALMPLVGRLSFAGSAMGVSGLWLGPGLLGTACAVLLLFAAMAAFAGLRKVEVTPLGVRTRQRPQGVKWIRAAVAVGGVVVIFVVYMYVPLSSQTAVFAVGFAFIAIPLLAVQLIGPWVLKVITVRQLKRAKTASQLIAARNVLESPQQMWRQVGGVAVAAFIGVIAGSGVGMINQVDYAHNPADAVLYGDLARGVWLTLFVAFLLTACSVGLNQTAQILDRRELYSGLAKMGLGLKQLHEIRRISVMRSLIAVLTVAVAAACVVAFPIVGAATVTSPTSVLTIAAVLAAGVAMIWLGTLSTRPTMRAVALAA